MANNIYGVKETKEVLVAAGDVAVIAYKAQKISRKEDGSVDVQKLAQNLAVGFMANPTALEHLKTAGDGIADVPKELTDLTLGESFELLAAAGAVASNCAQAIKE